MAKIKAKQIDPTGLQVTAAAFMPTGVQSGFPITVPENYQLIVMVDEFRVDDDLTLDGDLVLL